ncbi:hypothetical protein HAX54_015556 [Datura stramonium]|uniref:Uncharacterized protein n=1 Tax=Datura stramonium TaxID=4076 RepID=A0ABS8Y697_DATST|nr:hypothetical protein [Datura stramonium]
MNRRGTKAHEEAVHQTGFDDINETLEILTIQHKSMLKNIATQDEKIVELQKTLNTMASNYAGIGTNNYHNSGIPKYAKTSETNRIQTSKIPKSAKTSETNTIITLGSQEVNPQGTIKRDITLGHLDLRINDI